MDEEHGHEDAADLDHEHDRVLCHGARVQFLERIDDGRLEDGRVPEGGGLANRVLCHGYIIRCSAMGLSERTGKKVSAPTMRITPMSSPTKSGPSTGKVPGPLGT